MLRRLVPIALFAAACATPPAPDPSPDAAPVFATDPLVGARIAPDDVPVAPGDCAEATRRALAKPDLVVDKIPAPIVAKPLSRFTVTVEYIVLAPAATGQPDPAKPTA